MKWKDRSNLLGQHAFLSPSNVHWVNYTEDKLISVYENKVLAVERGTKLHEYACKAIELNRKQPKTKDTVSMYINDAIGYRMRSEQPLFYSNICFGTCDAIAFDEKKKLLRIHDLKTGVSPAHMEQLITYAALFCLDYRSELESRSLMHGGVPSDFVNDMSFELRIYQNSEIKVYSPTPDEILTRMDLIIKFSSILEDRKAEE